jgi:sugar O-acyltransferase (sialic acid O-acetyltransferase NeuD family)
MNSLAIVGSGGFGREVEQWAKYSGYKHIAFYVSDNLCNGEMPLSTLPTDMPTVIAIGNPTVRMQLVKEMSRNQNYDRIIHKTAITSSYNNGMILCPYAVITTNVIAGRHLHMNLHSDIGHDCVIGNYVTLAPGARVSGYCVIGDCVYVGTNAVIREGVHICDVVTIGAGAVVLNDITESGVYAGVPAKKIK